MIAVQKPSTKSSWFIVLPSLAILVLAAIWSVYWYVAASKAHDILEQVLAREKAKGVEITCATREIQGFPFKFRLDCHGLKVVQKTPSGLTVLTSSRLVAVVMAYNYNHLIAELYGPFDVTRSDSRPQNSSVSEMHKLFSGTAKTVKASVKLKNQAVKQSTLVIQGLDGTLIDYSQRSNPQAIKTSLENGVFHLRAVGSMKNTKGPYDLGTTLKNLSFVGGQANFQSAAGTKFNELLVRANITEVPYDLRGQPLELLKSWQASKGMIKITELKTNTGPVKLNGDGTISLDGAGRADGVINMRLSGLDVLVKNLVNAGRIPEEEANMGLTAIKLLGSTGNGDVRVAVKAIKGFLYLGPFKVARLKPLFER